jgi:hypothetical protein
VDYKISKGATDKTLVGFKPETNSRLKRNFMNQVGIYEDANATRQSIKVILYYSLDELQSVKAILKELKLLDEKSIILIDARKDNKKSASKV